MLVNAHLIQRKAMSKKLISGNMTKFNYDKINQQRRDKRKSVCIDTFKKTRQQDINSLWHSAIQRETVFLSGKYIQIGRAHV